MHLLFALDACWFWYVVITSFLVGKYCHCHSPLLPHRPALVISIKPAPVTSQHRDVDGLTVEADLEAQPDGGHDVVGSRHVATHAAAPAPPLGDVLDKGASIG